MPAKLLFSLIYGTLDDCLPLMCQLNRASSLDIGDQTAMVCYNIANTNTF